MIADYPSGGVIIRSYFAYFLNASYTEFNGSYCNLEQTPICTLGLGGPSRCPPTGGHLAALRFAAHYSFGSGPSRPTFAPSRAGSPFLRSGLLRIATAGGVFVHHFYYLLKYCI